MDWSGEASMDLNILEWYMFDFLAIYWGWGPGDTLKMYISNDCCSDFPHFTQFMNFDVPDLIRWWEDGNGQLDYMDDFFIYYYYYYFPAQEWHWRNLTIVPGDIPGGFTTDMCIRFEFITDSKFVARGWEVDYLELIGGTTSTTFIADEFNNLDGWVCTTGTRTLWHQISADCWAWDDAGVYYANMNDALVYFTDTTQAYNVDLEFYVDFLLGAGDIVYLEISNDNATWDIIDTFEGSDSGWMSYPINQYVPGQVFIRFRAVSDGTLATETGGFLVCDLALYGMLDLRAPASTCSLSGIFCDGVYTSDVKVTLTASDDVTGVKAIYYKLDGGPQQTYAAPFTVSAQGAHTVEFWSEDFAGNIEAPHNQCAGFTIKKDTSAPTVTITAPTAGITIFGNTIGIGSKVIIIGGFEAAATASDDSGIYSVKFYMDDVLFGESTGPTYTAYCGLKHMGAGVLKAVAIDNAGKTGTATLDVTYFKLL
jgi:hypothetical protein